MRDNDGVKLYNCVYINCALYPAREINWLRLSMFPFAVSNNYCCSIVSSNYCRGFPRRFISTLLARDGKTIESR